MGPAQFTQIDTQRLGGNGTSTVSLGCIMALYRRTISYLRVEPLRVPHGQYKGVRQYTHTDTRDTGRRRQASSRVVCGRGTRTRLRARQPLQLHSPLRLRYGARQRGPAGLEQRGAKKATRCCTLTVKPTENAYNEQATAELYLNSVQTRCKGGRPGPNCNT